MNENSFDVAFERVTTLVNVFSDNEKRYTLSTYSEAQARIDFIDKFWIALGWDVNHDLQTNPYEQEVKVERGVKTEGARKRADYAFLAANFRDVRFFVEAKKPFVELETPDNCFQVVRYGWNANAPLCVLTDFQGFVILDCRYKPDIQTAQNRVVKRFHYADYADKEKFAEIYYLFGREAVIDNGSLEKYAANLPKPRNLAQAGKQSRLFKTAFERIDTLFLLELDEIRGRLATSFKLTNPHFDGEGLTEATQKTIDRLVFMRFLEDKLIEQTPIFEDFERSGSSAWQSFINRSRELDRIYNGIIFKANLIDVPTFKVDADVFASICAELSPKESPYDFNAIPIEILGNIYERFLGKIIVIDEGSGAAKIEEKPEVRKAGGVYYTPEYIVRYIVENTVGELVKGKTPQQIAELRFADIACGSGSFLVGVYDYLLRTTAEFYNKPKNRKLAEKAGCIETETGNFRLNLAQRTNILLDNIYGVDIDAQAVEVSQLSLFLKLLEDETTASAQKYQQQKLKLLPTLDKNIVHGNALIDWDILDGQLFETREQRKLNPMSYVDKFPQIMRNGGFDAIVGNPPYVRQELITNIKSYLQTRYQTFHGVADLYVYFFERYAQLLKDKGVFSIIVANKWLRANYGEPLRRWLRKMRIEEITDFGDLPVFQGATTYPAIIRASKNEPNETFVATNIETLNFDEKGLSEYVKTNAFPIYQAKLETNGWSLTNTTTSELLQKLRAVGKPFGEYVNGKIYYGIKTGLNEAFVIDAATKEKLIAEDERSAELIKPFLLGRDIKRYVAPQNKSFLIFTRRGTNIEDYPAIKNYLSQFETQLRPKPKDWNNAKNGEWKGRKAGSYKWFEIQDSVDYYGEFEKPKIIVPAIVQKASYAFDDAAIYSNDKTCVIPTNDFYLLGLLNSKISDFYLHSIASTKQGGYFEYKPMYVSQIPIRVLNFDDKQDVASHDKMTNLVEQMLATKREQQNALTDSEKNFYHNKTNALERQIDALVYELYELTADEINIIESA